MEIFSPLSGELTAASDTSKNVSLIGELCLKPPVNVVRVRIFLKAKPNDHSLLALHPAAKIYTYRDIHILRIPLSRGEARMHSPGARKAHSIGCLAMHEALLGSRWI
jgi:hypothetical protein